MEVDSLALYKCLCISMGRYVHENSIMQMPQSPICTLVKVNFNPLEAQVHGRLSLRSGQYCTRPFNTVDVNSLHQLVGLNRCQLVRRIQIHENE